MPVLVEIRRIERIGKIDVQKRNTKLLMCRSSWLRKIHKYIQKNHRSSCFHSIIVNYCCLFKCNA